MRRTTEDYLKTIYMLGGGHTGVRGADIADVLCVSRPTVSIIVKRLNRDGYISMNQEHEIFLTASGCSLAKDTLERHDAISTLLEGLGVDEKIADKDACEMEHTLSPESFEALKNLVKERKGDVERD